MRRPLRSVWCVLCGTQWACMNRVCICLWVSLYSTLWNRERREYACMSVFSEDYNQNYVLLSQIYLSISSVRPVSITDVVAASWYEPKPSQTILNESWQNNTPLTSCQLTPACMTLLVQSKLPLRGRQQLSRQSHNPVHEAIICTWMNILGSIGLHGCTQSWTGSWQINKSVFTHFVLSSHTLEMVFWITMDESNTDHVNIWVKCEWTLNCTWLSLINHTLVFQPFIKLMIQICFWIWKEMH